MALRGSFTQQSWALMTRGGTMQLGESKGHAQETAKEELRNEGLPLTSANIAERTGVYNVDSAKQYISTWTQCADYAKENFGVKSLENLTGEHIVAYVDLKIELGNDRSSLQTELSALGKLASSLETWNGKDYDNIRGGIETSRVDVAEAPERALADRAYSDPSGLVKTMPDGQVHLAAKILYESGVRISEGTKINSEQLRGLGNDKHTGKEVGRFEYIGKGGKVGTATVSPSTYRDLERVIADNGKFDVKQSELREALKDAAGKEYDGRGVHGLRYSHAQERLHELQSHGMSRDEAKAVVSHELNHERPEITERYCAGK